MFSIVSLVPDDSKLLESIHKTSFAPYWKESTFSSLLSQGSTWGWKAQICPDVTAGFILAGMIFQEAEIFTLTVDPLYRRQGTGRLLLQTLIMFLHSKECKKLFIEVGSRNREALNLYQSYNFKNVGKRPKYYQIEKQEFDDAYIMVLDL